jgi:hypothetical protein
MSDTVKPLSLYDESAPIKDRIYYLKHYETYNPAHPINPKMRLILGDLSNNHLDDVIDAILYTRTINGGRGLRDLTYSYLWTLQQQYPIQAVFLLYRMMEFQCGKQIGCWRDIRAYADFISLYSAKGRNDPMLSPVLGLYNNQIIKDRKSMAAQRPISYAAKWVPRERKCPWMFEKLLNLWIYVDPEAKQIMSSPTSPAATIMARNKCSMNYRKLVSKMNVLLDTTEIKECAGRWAEIVPDKIPVNNLYLNRANFEKHGVKGAYSNRNYISGIPSWKLVKKMIHLQKAGNQSDIDILNAQWAARENRDEREYNAYIALVDVSAPMYANGAESLYRAIGLGCELAAKSLFGRRVMAFSPKPYWIDLESCSFGEMIQRMISAIWIPENYMDEAFSAVLDGVLFSDMVPEEVSKLKIVLITNRRDEVSLPTHIVEAWIKAGIKKFGRPFLLDGRNFEKIGV